MLQNATSTGNQYILSEAIMSTQLVFIHGASVKKGVVIKVEGIEADM
jgi:hypothetical protein